MNKILDSVDALAPPKTVPDALTPGEYYSLSIEYAQLCWFHQAYSCVEKICRLAPDSELSAKALILRDTQLPKNPPSKEAEGKLLQALYFRIRNPAECRRLLKECIDQYPEFEAPYDSLAYCEGFDNNWSEAERLYKRAVEINSRYSHALCGLIDISYRKNKMADARAYLHRVLNNNPDDPNGKGWDWTLSQQSGGLAFIQYVFHTRSPYGLIDRQGRLVFKAPQGVTEFKEVSDGLVTLPTRRGLQICNLHGKPVFSLVFDDTSCYSEGLCAICVDKKWGFIDEHGNAVIKPQFSVVGDFNEDVAAVKLDRWGFIDRQGQLVIAAEFEQVLPFSEGLAAVEKAGKIGFINRSGEMTIAPQYDYVSSFSGGLALAGKIEGSNHLRHLQYIDRKGDVRIDVNKVMAAANDPDQGVISGDPPPPGRNVLSNREINYHRMDDFMGAKHSPEQFSDGLVQIRIGTKYGYMDQTGAIVIQPRFNYVSPFSEGLARVDFGEPTHGGKITPLTAKGKMGFINTKGDFVIQPRFSYAGDFSEGLAAVQENKGWGFIDQSGKVIVPEKFDDVGAFHNGLAQVGFPPDSL